MRKKAIEVDDIAEKPTDAYSSEEILCEHLYRRGRQITFNLIG